MVRESTKKFIKLCINILLTKYTKSLVWGVVARLFYIWDAWYLRVRHLIILRWNISASRLAVHTSTDT